MYISICQYTLQYIIYLCWFGIIYNYVHFVAFPINTMAISMPIKTMLHERSSTPAYAICIYSREKFIFSHEYNIFVRL